jgi:hypothetical protein
MKTLAVIVTLAAASLLFAQDEKQIQDAIRGLGAESFEEREKATVDLKKIGAPALEALKKAADESDDPEVRIRAKRLIETITKPAPRKPAAGKKPGPASIVSIRRTKEGTVYGLQPADGDAIEFVRGTEGKAKLVYPDGKGGTAEAESESVEKFLADHKGLAEKYGITKDGIEYGGSKLQFSSPLPQIPGFAPLELPAPLPLQPLELEDLFKQSEELRKAFEDLRLWREVPFDRPMGGAFGFNTIRGAQFGRVPEVLRSQLSIPEGQGVVVETVREGSTAAAAGLMRHDVILEIDGKKVTGLADVRANLNRDSKIKALRAGREQMLQPPPPRKKEF